MCGNNRRFIVDVWVRITFRYNEDGSKSILDTRFLEAIEEKLVDGEIRCAMCGADAKLISEEG